MTTRRVLYIQYTNPASYPPLHHSATLLAESGCDVLLLGTSLLADSLTFPAHARIQVRLMPFQSGGWRQKLHYARFTAWVIATAVWWRPTWVYASDPLSCPVVLSLMRLLGARVVYHEHDSPARDAALGRTGSRFMRGVMKARRKVAMRSRLCVLPNSDRARLFAETTGRADALVVWNCPSRDEALVEKRESPLAMHVLYHGSVVPARLPRTVVEAMALLPSSVSLVVVGYATAGYPEYLADLSALAKRLGISERVEFIGPLSRHALMERCASGDVGLALLPTDSTDVNEQSMVGASNKPFEYLACGLALLVADRPEWRATFVESGLGRSCDPRSPESIATALQWFSDRPAERREMGERGRRRVRDEWNYAAQFAPVMRQMLEGMAPHESVLSATNHAEPTAPC